MKLDELKLKQLNKKVAKDPVKTALRRVLVRSKLSEVAEVLEQKENTQFKFSIDIKTLPITNQKASGRCWIFSGLNFLRQFVAKKLDVEEFEFSQNYVAFYDKLEKINYFLDSMDDFLTCDSDDRTLQFLLQGGIQDGGQWQMFVNLIKKYGLVPKASMQETFSSSNTGKMNQFINIKLRKYAADARALVARSELNKVQELKEKVLDELYSFLTSNFGLPPQSVNFEYVDKKKKYHHVSNITPLEFFDKYVGINLDDYVSIINSPTNDKPFNKTYTVAYLGNVVEGDIVKHFNVEMPRLKELIISQLKDNEIVWFGCDVSTDGNREEGVWDDRSFAYSEIFGLNLEMTKAQTLDYRVSAMNHAMVICGVNLLKNKPNKWKIENSWGEKAGNKGFYLASDTWFDKYTYQAVVNKKYLTEEERKAVQTEPVVLKPWDPMGTLA